MSDISAAGASSPLSRYHDQHLVPYPPIVPAPLSNRAHPRLHQQPEGLPAELLSMVLESGRPWCLRDVRSFSQTSTLYNRVVQAVEPELYQQAHQPTLHQAFAKKRFPFHNTRVKNVLSQFTRLHLLGSDAPKRRRTTCNPARTTLPHLRAIVSMLPQATCLIMGPQTRSFEPLFHLLHAGFALHHLDELCFKQAGTIEWRELNWLHHSFPLMPNLKILRLPTQFDGQSDLMTCSFAPLKRLREIDWHMGTAGMPIILDLGENREMKTVKLRFPQPAPHHTAHCAISMPDAPMRELHLKDIRINGQLALYLERGPWRSSLEKLVLTISIIAESLDLRQFTNLKTLVIKASSQNIRRLLLPAGQIENLDIGSLDAARVMQQLRTSDQEPLKTLALRFSETIPLDGSVPWRQWTKLTHLTLDYGDSRHMDSRFLNLPVDNRITHLSLASNFSRAVSDIMFSTQPMPHMHTLDITALRWGLPMANVLNAALASKVWPQLTTLRIDSDVKGLRPSMLRAMNQVAAYHNLDIVDVSAPAD